MKTDRSSGTLRPLTNEHWTPRPMPDPSGPWATRAWLHRRAPLVVVTSVGMANAPDGSGDVIAQWHLSIAGRVVGPDNRPFPVRASAVELAHMVATFGLDDYEIDNHHPGAAQHLWIPKDPTRRVDCECKSDELIIVEPDGYTWTTPTDGPCRGCQFERTPMGRPCPIHTTGTVVLDEPESERC